MDQCPPWQPQPQPHWWLPAEGQSRRDGHPAGPVWVTAAKTLGSFSSSGEPHFGHSASESNRGTSSSTVSSHFGQ
jgi:hypothetical protein